MNVTQLIVDSYTHVEFEGIARHEFGPGEKNLVEKGRKMVKTGESGSEATKAHAWTPCKPNIFSLTAPPLTLHVGIVYEGIPKADRGPGVKKWTVIGGRKGRFLRYQQRRRSLRYSFERLTAITLQRWLALSSVYYRRPARRLLIRSERSWSRTEGPGGRESSGPPPTMPRFTIHRAIFALSAQVRRNENLPYALKINDPFGVVVTIIQI